MLGFNGGLIGATRTTTGQASVPGIWTPREQLRARRESLWPVVVTYVDPYASSVSLYLKGDGPNASTTFIDSSPAPKTVTAVGNAQISTAQSKSGGASILFDGSGDYLSTPDNEAWNFGSGEFTIEFWTRPSGFGSYNAVVAQWPNNNASSSNSFVVETVTNSTLYFYAVTSSLSAVGATGPALTQGQWQHIAIVRSGNNLIFFKDGVQHSTHAFNITLNNPTSALTVGGNVAGAGWWNGYIDDLRITKGFARYTANFTPTYDADPYASSTVLLLRGDGVNGSTTFLDGSSSPKAITAVGNAQISTAQSKSGGASMLFDGSGDYVEVSSNTAFEFGTGDFTIELWFYMSTLPATFALFSGCAGRNFYFGIGTYSGNRYLISYDGSAELNQVSGTSITAGTWYHAAHCRSGGTARLFLNGNEVRSGSFGSITGTTGYQVGASPFYAQYYFNGYIDDFRITKGVARYTSNFTPPGAL